MENFNEGGNVSIPKGSDVKERWRQLGRIDQRGGQENKQLQEERNHASMNLECVSELDKAVFILTFHFSTKR